MSLPLEYLEKENQLEENEVVYHHHLTSYDREFTRITGFLGPLKVLCGKDVSALANPYDHPCCPECAKRLTKQCRASS